MATKADLNNASQAQLMKTDEIGKTLAKRIKEHAPFANWEEVGRIRGIGPNRLKNLQARFEIQIDVSAQTSANDKGDEQCKTVPDADHQVGTMSKSKIVVIVAID